jgi:hypothetical protein
LFQPQCDAIDIAVLAEQTGLICTLAPISYPAKMPAALASLAKTLHLQQAKAY